MARARARAVGALASPKKKKRTAHLSSRMRGTSFSYGCNWVKFPRESTLLSLPGQMCQRPIFAARSALPVLG